MAGDFAHDPQRPDVWTWLQAWFVTRCDGEWEHDHGVTITRLDNPGWSVAVDLAGSHLDPLTYVRRETHRSEDGWCVTWTEGALFRAACGPGNLAEALTEFRCWVTRHRVDRTSRPRSGVRCSTLLSGLASGLLSGRRAARASEAAARRRLASFRDGLRVFVPLELAAGRTPVRRRREVRLMAGQPRETAFGWWDERWLGKPEAALLGTRVVAADDWPGGSVRPGRKSASASGSRATSSGSRFSEWTGTSWTAPSVATRPHRRSPTGPGGSPALAAVIRRGSCK